MTQKYSSISYLTTQQHQRCYQNNEHVSSVSFFTKWFLQNDNITNDKSKKKGVVKHLDLQTSTWRLLKMDWEKIKYLPSNVWLGSDYGRLFYLWLSKKKTRRCVAVSGGILHIFSNANHLQYPRLSTRNRSLVTVLQTRKKKVNN